MGIRSEEQLSIHPSRGNLFENMIINDVYKNSYNRIERADLYFYRDQRQHEVDLLQLTPDNKLKAYELKSSKTYRTDYFEGLHYLQKIMSDRLISTCMLYDGEQQQLQQYDAYCNYKNIF